MTDGLAPAIASAQARAQAHAPFLRGLLRREPELLETIQRGSFATALAQSIARLDPANPAATLRAARDGVALVTALADLSATWSLEQVTRALSDFADVALDFAITAAFAERDVQPAGLSALALGKMGSRELNYSSDVDLILDRKSVV